MQTLKKNQKQTPPKKTTPPQTTTLYNCFCHALESSVPPAPFCTLLSFFSNPSETVKTMALVAKGNVFKEAVTGDIGKLDLRGNNVASGETEGNKLRLDATVRGWRSLPKGNKGKKEKRKKTYIKELKHCAVQS